MNRFKKTMALTAACVIAVTAVNVGGVAHADLGLLQDREVVGVQAQQAEEKIMLTGLKAVVNEDGKTIVITTKEALESTGKMENLSEQFVVYAQIGDKEYECVVDKIKIENKTIELVLDDALKIKFGHKISISYELSDGNRIDTIKSSDKLVGSFMISSENVDVTAIEADSVIQVEKIEKVALEKDQKTTSKIRVTFSDKTPGAVDQGIPGLEAEEVQIAGAKAESVKLISEQPGKTYEVGITDVTSNELTVNFIRDGVKFIAAENGNKVSIDYVGTSNIVDSGRSSVRPGESTSFKKDEMKKEEPKKDEMKKDDISNMEKSTDKVSTKLVIGKKTYTAMVNGQAIEKTMDVAPMVHMGRTVLPARMISELLGVGVKFDQKTKTASFMYGEDNKVELTLGQKFMMVNGEKVALTADILNKDGRILLPVTDIQKAFAKLGLEANVAWDAATKTVTIEK